MALSPPNLKKRSSLSRLKLLFNKGSQSQDGMTELELERIRYKAWRKTRGSHSDKECLLHFACEQNCLLLLKESLQTDQARGYRVLDSSGRSALAVALRKRHTHCVRALLELGGGPHLQNSVILEALMLAVLMDEMKMLTAILASSLATPLILAVTDLDDEFSPLRHSFDLRRYTCVIKIIEFEQTNGGRRQVNPKPSPGAAQVLKMLLQCRQVHQDVPKDFEKIANYLLSRGAELNAADYDQTTLMGLLGTGNDLKVISFLLEASHADNFSQLTENILVYGADTKSEPIIRFVLEHGDLSRADGVLEQRLWELLRSAVSARNTKFLKLLLSHFQTASLREISRGNNLFLMAMNIDAIDVAKILINHDRGVLDVRDRRGKTPLMDAIMLKKESFTRLMLNSKPNVNLADGAGNTALHIAAQHTASDEVDLLLDLEADCTIENNSGQLPIDLAIISRNYPAYLRLRKAHPKAFAEKDFARFFSAAIQANQPDILSDVLPFYAGSLDEPVGSCRDPPLLWSIRHHRPKIAEELIDNGANVHLEDRKGGSLLNLAMDNHMFDTALRLVKGGADVNHTREPYDPRPIHQACSFGNIALVEALLAAGADLQQCPGLGGTPLSCAIRDRPGSYEIVQLLLRAGANPNEGSSTWPLHEALNLVRQDLALLLLEHGAHPGARDHESQTVQEKAQAKSCYLVLEKLKTLTFEIDAVVHRTPRFGVDIIKADSAAKAKSEPAPDPVPYKEPRSFPNDTDPVKEQVAAMLADRYSHVQAIKRGTSKCGVSAKMDKVYTLFIIQQAHNYEDLLDRFWGVGKYNYERVIVCPGCRNRGLTGRCPEHWTREYGPDPDHERRTRELMMLCIEDQYIN